ncbi:MAG: YvrJ family protein [Syntrophomonadaceae bacterium]
MDELINLIGNVGFPIAISVYLLIRVESQLDKLTLAIGELREAIITLPAGKLWSTAGVTACPTLPSFEGKPRINQ